MYTIIYVHKRSEYKSLVNMSQPALSVLEHKLCNELQIEPTQCYYMDDDPLICDNKPKEAVKHHNGRTICCMDMCQHTGEVNVSHLESIETKRRNNGAAYLQRQ
jgi:hypothetical protein